MICKGTTHDNGGKLARYMVTGKAGEMAELWELRGFASPDIIDAFRSVHVMAGATKCHEPFFHVQVRNPQGESLSRDQWEYTANRIERMLGLKDQPRAIAFHIEEQTGDRHMHIAWSRIDDQTMTAKPLPFFKERLKKISRELEMHFGITVVPNEREGSIKYAPTRAEEEQSRRLGLDAHEVRQTIRDCFERSDSGRAFEAALAEQWMVLAQGERRDYVVIDQAGGMYALGKRILGTTAAETRERLADLSRENLPSVEQAKEFAREQAELRHQEKQAPVWDRDRDEVAWQKSIVDAAIAREMAGGAGPELHRPADQAAEREPNQQAAEKPGGEGRDFQELFTGAAERACHDAGPPREPAAPSLKGSARDIWEARQEADNAHEFVSALSQRRLRIAVVTEADKITPEPLQDARHELAQMIDLKDKGVWLVAVGGVDQLTEKQQESAARSYDGYRHVHHEQERLSLGEYVSHVQRQNALHFEHLKEEAAELDRLGVPLPPAEAQQPLIRARVGTVVVLNERGYLYYLNERTTGVHADQMQTFMAAIDPQSFRSVTETREEIEEERKRSRVVNGNRWIAGPQTGRMVEHQDWALDQVKAADEHRRRQERSGMSPTREKQSAEEEQEIDRARFKTDPGYRRSVEARVAEGTAAQRQLIREEQREASRDFGQR
jgi:hypothetical protein